MAIVAHENKPGAVIDAVAVEDPRRILGIGPFEVQRNAPGDVLQAGIGRLHHHFSSATRNAHARGDERNGDEQQDVEDRQQQDLDAE